MPLSAKGQKIMANMQSQYGSKKGKSVFYASKNKGTISGVDETHDVQGPPLDQVQAALMKRLMGKPAPSYDNVYKRVMGNRARRTRDEGMSATKPGSKPLGETFLGVKGEATKDQPGTTPITQATTGPVEWHDQRRAALRLFRDAVRLGVPTGDASLLAAKAVHPFRDADDPRPPSKVIDISEQRDPRGVVMKREHHVHYPDPQAVLAPMRRQPGLLGIRPPGAEQDATVAPQQGNAVMPKTASSIPVHGATTPAAKIAAIKAKPKAKPSVPAKRPELPTPSDVPGRQTIGFFRQHGQDAGRIRFAKAPETNHYGGGEFKDAPHVRIGAMIRKAQSRRGNYV